VSRLGDLLLIAGLLSHEQLDQALRAQVVWGGRLGTNLIELGCLDLDALATALGKQHGLPPALGRHFDRADPVIQDDLPGALAEKYSVVPLLRFGDPPRIAVVSIDPLTADARDEIAEAFGLECDQIVPSIAAEMRVRYHLERVYGIKRSARFLRSRGKTIPPFPLFDPSSMPFDIEEPTSPIVVPEQPVPTILPAEADDLAAMIDAAIDKATAPSEPAGRERRSYIKLIAEEASGPKDTQPLGRIPIRRVAVTSPPPSPRPEKATRVPLSLTDATRAIRRAAHRDRAADLIIDTLQRFAPVCEAAMLLVIRGDAAIGWKYFCRDGATPSELAVPMDQDGLCPIAAANGCTARAAADALSAIDMLLVRALGRTGGDLVVVPIPIAGKVMCLIAAVTERGGAIAPIETIAAAGATAFARLIRDASR
jgi:Type II secretion system (T2SS), protein E, N-terminal domain